MRFRKAAMGRLGFHKAYGSFGLVLGRWRQGQSYAALSSSSSFFSGVASPPAVLLQVAGLHSVACYKV